MSNSPRPAGINLSEKTLSGMLWMAAASFVQFGLQLVSLAVLARLLTPADFGVAAASSAIIAFSMLFSDLAFGPALVQRNDLTSNHIRTAFTASTILGILICSVIFELSDAIGAYFRMPPVGDVTKVLGIVFIWQGLSTVSENLLSRHLRFRVLAIVKITSFIVGTGVVSIAMAYMGYAYWSLVGGFLAQSILNMAMVLVASRHDVRPLIHTQSLRDLLKFGGGLSIGRVVNYLAMNGDRLVIGRAIGVDVLGLYDRAIKLASMPGSLYELAASKVALSSLSRVQNEPKRLLAAYRRGLALTALIGMPMTALLIVLAPQLIDVMLGPQWHDVIIPFSILSLATGSRLTFRVSNSVLVAKGRIYTFLVVQVAYAAFVIGGCYALAPYGISAVSWVVTTGVILNNIVLCTITIRLTGMTLGQFLKAHAPGLVFGIVTAAAALLVVAAAGAVLSSGAVLVLACIAVLVAMFGLLAVPSKTLWGEDGLWLRDRCLGALRHRPGLRRDVSSEGGAP